MIETIKLQLLEMVARGIEPAAIVGSPPQIKRLFAECRQGELHPDPRKDSGSGWTFEGLPVWRCWEIGGPCVVSYEVLKVLRREYRTHWGSVAADEPVSRAQTDLLF